MLEAKDGPISLLCLPPDEFVTEFGRAIEAGASSSQAFDIPDVTYRQDERVVVGRNSMTR